MKILALVLNLFSLAFSCLVMATDGPATQPAYVVLGLLLIVVPLLTASALLRSWTAGGAGTAAQRLAAVANAVLLGFVCWAFADQYPHPTETGFIPYAVVMALTPIVSVVALLWRGRRVAQAGQLGGA